MQKDSGCIASTSSDEDVIHSQVLNATATTTTLPPTMPAKRPVAKPVPGPATESEAKADRELPSVWYRAMTYRCHFCLNPLQAGPRGLVRVFWAMLSLRVGYCPHCFVVRTHPIGPLKLLLAPFRAIYTAFLDAEES